MLSIVSLKTRFRPWYNFRLVQCWKLRKLHNRASSLSTNHLSLRIEIVYFKRLRKKNLICNFYIFFISSWAIKCPILNLFLENYKNAYILQNYLFISCANLKFLIQWIIFNKNKLLDETKFQKVYNTPLNNWVSEKKNQFNF